MIQKLLLNTEIIWMTFIKNMKEYDPNKKRKILIAFDLVIADMLSSAKRNPIITELFIWERKLNTSLLFIT